MNSTPEMSLSHPVKVWLWLGLFLVLLMLMVGSITRLTESGLSITDWRPITGTIPPFSQDDWEMEFEKYRKSPEFLYKNSNFSLSDFKTIFWWEWAHRFIARLIGVVYIIPLIYFHFKKIIPRKIQTHVYLVGALGLLQGFFGWFMVKSGLVLEPRVSHYRLVLHLITALLISSLIFWQILSLNDNKASLKFSSGVKSCTYLALIALIIQIILGAFVAGKDAGQLYNTWPKMGDAWVPESVFAASPWYLNILENESGIQFFHRSFAWIVYLLILLVTIKILKSNPNKSCWNLSVYLLVGIHLQIILGILTLIYAVPIVLGVLHQLVAALILLGFVKLIFYLSIFRKS